MPDALLTHAPEWRSTAGLTPYADAVTIMERRAAAIRNGDAPEQVWLVEHPPLYTAGASARLKHLRVAARLPVHRSHRGGQWTYHGPGQRVAYPMLDLTRRHGTVPPRDVRRYVHALEEWLILALARFGMQGERRFGRPGIWMAEGDREAKIAAVGVSVTRWVTWHGVSINVAPDLEHYDGIMPCGIAEHGVTSLARLGRAMTMGDVDAALRSAWPKVFGG